MVHAYIDTSPLMDGTKLCAQLDTLMQDGHWSDKKHQALIEIYKQYHQEALAEIQQRLQIRYMQIGHVLSRLVADHTDHMLCSLINFMQQHIYPNMAQHFAIIATGGYGRREMAPFSDIDILFLVDDQYQEENEALITEILRILWDLKFKLGQSVATIHEALALAKDDITIMTTYLDARFLTGNMQLFDNFHKDFTHKIIRHSPQNFIRDKLIERDMRHEKMGGSRYLLEPNIKEGTGTLRDMQTLMWLAKYTHNCHDINQIAQQGLLTSKSARLYERAYRFFWTVRFWLHMSSNRANEQLSFEYQKIIAEQMGYRDTKRAQGVERFMRHLFMWAEIVGRLSGVVSMQLESQYLWDNSKNEIGFKLDTTLQEHGFVIQNSMIFHENPARLFLHSPIWMIKLFHYAQRSNLAIHPEVLRYIKRRRNKLALLRKDPETITLALDIIRTKGASQTLRQMSELGVLGKLLPYWNVIRWQMQYNMYHHYTTDEHTLRLFDYYDALKRGEDVFDAPWLLQITQQVDMHSPIIPLALLLHDIGKGRAKHHSIIGAEIAEDACKHLGLSKADSDMVTWLVRHHLEMSDTSARRDLDDMATIKKFVTLVESPIKLRYLSILTACDIKAVGPNIWNHWKSSLLQTLYRRSLAQINGEVYPEYQRIHEKREQLEASGVSSDILAIFPDNWYLNFQIEQQQKHIRWLTEAQEKGFVIEHSVSNIEQTNQITIIAPERKGILSQLAGALAAARVNILDVRVLTLHNKMLLDSFQFTDLSGAVITDPFHLQTIEDNIQKTIQEDQDWHHKTLHNTPIHMRNKYQNFHVNGRVEILSDASKYATVIEVTGKDRPGFLFDITQVLLKYQMDITSARIVTYGEKAVDVFYVQDALGHKIINEMLLENLRQDLLHVATATI